MASYTKRGDKWRAELYRDGKRESKSFSTKTAARLWALQREDELEKGYAAIEGQSLRGAFERYAKEISPTKSGDRWEVVRLAAFAKSMRFVDEPMVAITPDDVAKWRDERLKSVSPGSVRREMSLLTSVFEIARREWRWLPSNPLRDVRKPRNPPSRVQRVTDEHANMIFAVAGYQRGAAATNTLQISAAAFDFALATAMRAGEILALVGEHIHLDRRFVHLPKTKNGSARDVPLSSEAVLILSGLDQQRPFPISSAVLDQTFRRLRGRAGLREAFSFHDSRAEATTRLAKRLDIHDLARMTGHKDLKSLLVYYRATPEEIAGRLG
jgi:integrase